MNSGGELQLTAIGTQNDYMIGNPQISFYKVVYKRHTNFSTEHIKININKDISIGSELLIDIPRNGDLLSNCYLEFDIYPGDGNDLKIYGLSILENIQCLINNNVIDSHSYRYIHAYMSSLVDTDTLNHYYSYTYVKETFNQKIKIPLLFWFCKNYGNTLPLIALQYSPVQFNIKISDYLLNDAITKYNNYSINSLNINCKYIFLDSRERRQIALTKHEYLIEQVQENKIDLQPSNGTSEIESNLELEIYYPTKYLLWYLGKNQLDDNENKENNIYLTSAQLKLNNEDRFEEQDYNYFKHLQFLNSGFVNKLNNHYKKSFNYIDNISDDIQKKESLNYNDDNIQLSPLYYMYSFALKPYHIQPSGTCNFSRVKTTTIIIKHKSLSITNTTTSKLHLFAINYNILKIESGIGGLAFSN